MQLHRRFLALAATATLLAGASACGDGEKAEPAPSAAATTTAPATSEPAPSTTAPPARPDVPAPDPADFPGKDERTEEGAQQAFRYFWAVAVWGRQTGDSATLASLHTANCQLCVSQVRDIDTAAAEGRYWTSTTIQDAVLETSPDESFEQVVSYGFTLSAHDEPVTGTETDVRVAPTSFAVVGGLVWTDTGWSVDYVEAESWVVDQ